MNISEIRQKYPQYEKLSDEQLAEALHRKFYSSMPKAEFDQKIGLRPQPAAAGGDWQDTLSAGFTAGVNAIPIAGPSIMSGLNQAKAGLHNNVLPALGINTPQTTPEELATENAQLEQANPVASTIGAVTGTVAPFLAGGAIPLVSRALGMSGGLGSRVMLGGISGGIIGGADTMARGGNLGDAVTSGGIGAGLGAALPIAGRGLSAIAGRVMGKTVPKDAKLLGRALRDDNIPASEINQRLTDMGPGAMVMDLGPNLQRQAGAIAAVPGAGQKAIRSAVDARTAGAGTRVSDDVARTLGTGPELGALREQIVAAQQQAAAPLYDAVRDVPVDLLKGNYAFVLNTPMGKEALAAGRRMAANDGYKGTDTVGIIDYTKRALDDMASSGSRSGNRNQARQAAQLARVLTSETDKMVPQYKAARDAFAGPAQVLDAMDAGEAIFTKEMTPRQLQQSLGAMSTSERDAFIQAARSSVEANMGNAVNEALTLRNMFKKSFNEDKLRILLGKDVADDLLKRINREAAFGKTAGVVTQNSETAARSAAMGEVAPELGRTMRPDGLVGLLFTAFDGARGKLSGIAQPKVNSRLAGIHTAGKLSPAQIAQIARGAQKPPNALLGPATGGLLTGKDKPLEITIGR